MGLAGCASLHSKTEKAYDTYWACVSKAVQPYIKQQNLSPRGAVVQAQAKCKSSYKAFRARQIDEVAANLDTDSRDVASQLGAHQALIWRKRVSNELVRYVRQSRRLR